MTPAPKKKGLFGAKAAASVEEATTEEYRVEDAYRDPLLPPEAEDLAQVSEELENDPTCEPLADDDADLSSEAELQTQLNAVIHDLKLERASFQTYRARVDKEKAEIRKYAGQELAQDLLRVLDYFEMSLKFDLPELSGPAQSVIEGVQYTVAELHRVLESHGITPIPTEGLIDPNLMEVIGTEERSDLEPGTILSVANTGYFYKDRVLRPARVTVVGETS